MSCHAGGVVQQLFDAYPGAVKKSDRQGFYPFLLASMAAVVAEQDENGASDCNGNFSDDDSRY
jgi:hypothetical protein